MKRFLVLFLVLAMAAGFAAAQEEEEGIGLTAGLEFGIGNINDADNMDPYLMPMIIYENSFLEDALDVYAEVDYYIYLNEDVPMSLYVDLAVGYNLGLAEDSTLSFILENEFDTLDLNPDFALTGIFTPAVQFTQGFEDVGDFYAKIGVPITYFDGTDYTTTGLDFTIGWESSFGLGLEAIIKTLIDPVDVGYYELEATISYETGPVYCEVNMIFPKEADEGITITPEFDYALGNLTLYTWIEFAGIGVEDGLSITPAIGVKFSF